MPALATWTDYLPDGGQAREVVAEAEAKTKSTVASLETAGARACGEALVDLAAEIVRANAIAPLGSASYYPALPALARAIGGLDGDPSRRAIAGVLAFANILLSRGGYIDGYYDNTTREGLEREIAWLDLATRLAKGPDDVDRVLGFAALAAGRSDLAITLSSDPALARLVASIGKPPREAWRAFFEFVEGFPTASHGYPELALAARAYVVHVEKRGAGGIGHASTWLHRTIHEGAEASYDKSKLEPVLPPPPPALEVPSELAARIGAFVSHDPAAPPQRLSFASLEYRDVHGLWGGRAIRITGDGSIEAIVAPPGPAHWRYLARLSPAGAAALDELVRSCPIRAITPPKRNGIAGEAHPSITLVDEGGTCSVGKWANDAYAPFDYVAKAMNDLVTLVAGSRAAEDAGDWSTRWRTPTA